MSISQHQHIKITTDGHCLICRNFEEIQNIQIVKIENIIYRIILKLSERALKEVSPPFKKEKKGPKRIRDTITK